jgi:hypothetical protein
MIEMRNCNDVLKTTTTGQARSKRLKTKVKNHRIPMRTTPEAKFVLKSFQKTSEKVRVCGPTKSSTHDQPQVGTY